MARAGEGNGRRGGSARAGRLDHELTKRSEGIDGSAGRSRVDRDGRRWTRVDRRRALHAPLRAAQKVERAKEHVVRAEVPLAETLGYAGALRALTRGLGRFTPEPTRYESVPAYVGQRLRRS